MSDTFDPVEGVSLPIETFTVSEETISAVPESDIPVLETVAVVEEVDVPVAAEVVEAAPVEEVYEAPVVVEPAPEPYVAPVVEPSRPPIWPWALGALALAGLATALAWPRPTAPVAEPEPTVTPVVHVQPSATPDVGAIQIAPVNPAPTAAPIYINCGEHRFEVQLDDGGESLSALIDNSIRVPAELTESASGARYIAEATDLPWSTFGSDWTLELWNKGPAWWVSVNDNALDCIQPRGGVAEVTVTG